MFNCKSALLSIRNLSQDFPSLKVPSFRTRLSSYAA
jgi:hypothetical protein